MDMTKLSLLTDLYELTMMDGYLANNMQDRIVVFDVFYRKNPCGNGFAICAGLEQVVEYIENLRFTPEEVEYLAGLQLFSAEFLDYLRTFRFTGDIAAIP